jgi:hypothetical protein
VFFCGRLEPTFPEPPFSNGGIIAPHCIRAGFQPGFSGRD